MKILMCDNRLGGLLGFRADIIRHFRDFGHEVCLVSPPAVSNWDKVGVCDLADIRIITVDMQPSGLNPLKDFQLFLQYLQIFRSEKPDIVFNYTIKPNIYSSIAASFCGVRVVCMLAGLGYMFDGKGLLKSIGLQLYKFGLARASKVLVLNQMNREKILGKGLVPESNVILLQGGEGVNLQDYPCSEADYSQGTTFLMVSRILYDKGYREFVEAARAIAADGAFPMVKFEILGPLDYDSPMGVPKDVFEHDQKAGVFNYLGVTRNVASFVGRHDTVIVLPSKYGEGLNRSLMEACSMGRPIITTDIPGCRETVEDGTNGYLIPTANPLALKEAMVRFLQLPAPQKELMAAASRLRAEKCFDVKNVIKVYDDILFTK